jgi:hypothetical protein
MLPKEITHDEIMPILSDDVVTYNSTAVPVNGAQFGTNYGNQIIVDLPAQDFLIPDSLFIKYQIQVTTTTAAGTVIGTPAYTPFYRLEIQCNGITLESQQQYNLIQNLITNITLNQSQKLGLQEQYGYSFSASGTATNPININGRLLSTNIGETYTVSVPLQCILSMCKKYIPLFRFPSFRLIFTLDTIANMMGYTATSVNTSYIIQNFEVGYELFNPGSAAKNEFLAKYKKIPFKTQSFAYMTQPIPSSSGGTIYLNYNVHFKSIKSAWLYLSSQSPANQYSVNGQYDSWDVTQGQGDYSITIAGVQYPNKVMNVQYNRTGVMSELRKAATTLGIDYDTIFDKSNNMSISTEEFSYIANGSTSTKLTVPSKFYIGIHTERLHNKNYYFSGISSQNTAIVVRINCGSTSTAQAFNCALILAYDILLEFDTETQQITLSQ